ncbi:MAG: discoidin domain-containing protein [Eubacteriales bacterium]
MKKLPALILTLCLAAGLLSVFSLVSPAQSNSVLDDYVTDGLAAFYAASHHSADGKTWLDASGNGLDLDLASYDESNNYFDGEKGVFVNKSTKIFFDGAIATLISTGKFTTEMVIKDTDVTGSDFGTYLNCTNDAYSLFMRLNDPANVFVEFKCGTNQRPKVAVPDKNYFKDSTVTVTFDYSTGVNCLYVNGALLQSKTPTEPFTVTDFYLGHNDGTRSHDTEFACIRFYDRALTAAEVAENYAADNGGSLPIDTSGDTSEPPAAKQNRAEEQPYTASGIYVDPNNQSIPYPDTDGKELTDGVIPSTAVYSDPAWVGFSANSTDYKESGYAEIVVDLGEVSEITGVNIVLSNLGSAGIGAPKEFVYSYSEDGENWNELGYGAYDIEPAANLGAIINNYLNESAAARYVRARFKNSEGNGWMFIGEFQVFEDAETPVFPDDGSSEGQSPPTGDAGIALAVLVAITALAGAVIVKKRS